MIEEFLSDPTMLAFLVIMVIFIVIAYKVVKILAKAAVIGLVAALFPIFANYFLGFEIPITVWNILWFAVTGVGLFFLYSFVRTGFGIIKLITAPIRALFRGKKRKDRDS